MPYYSMPVTICTYVWIDGTGTSLRSKTRVVQRSIGGTSDVEDWSFDGSSTGQATIKDSDVILKPVALYDDPFLGNINRLVLCETFDSAGRPLPSNKRHQCLSTLQKIDEKYEPWFGIEQEYVLVDPKTNAPLGYDGTKSARNHYCGVGTGRAYGRQISDEHLTTCIRAGIKMAGTNAEVLRGQWEFQIGPCRGIKAADELLMARYILERVAEKHGVIVDYNPKIIKGESGSGAHVNFSTKQMRMRGGLKEIRSAIAKLQANHDVDIKSFDARNGEDNKLRLTGEGEISSYDRFTNGDADRTASVRIPRHVIEAGSGYLEDRRPASNADPYRVLAVIAQACCS